MGFCSEVDLTFLYGVPLPVDVTSIQSLNFCYATSAGKEKLKPARAPRCIHRNHGVEEVRRCTKYENYGWKERSNWTILRLWTRMSCIEQYNCYNQIRKADHEQCEGNPPECFSLRTIHGYSYSSAYSTSEYNSKST